MKKAVVICDSCGAEIEDGKGGAMRLNYDDARRGTKAADLCGSCSDNLPGHPVARRGRKPKVEEVVEA